jgi:hypothetical protein
MKDTANPQTLSDLHEHGRVFDVDYLPCRRLGNVQGKPIYVRVGLTDVDVARGDKGIHEIVQLELMDPIIIHNSRLVADDDYFQPVSDLEMPD